MPAASVTLRRPLTKPTNLVTRAVTRLSAGTPNLVKNHPVSLTRFPAATANLVNSVTKLPRSTTSLVTSRLTKLTAAANLMHQALILKNFTSLSSYLEKLCSHGLLACLILKNPAPTAAHPVSA
jgi:hypothetical protein